MELLSTCCFHVDTLHYEILQCFGSASDCIALAGLFHGVNMRMLTRLIIDLQELHARAASMMIWLSGGDRARFIPKPQPVSQDPGLARRC